MANIYTYKTIQSSLIESTLTLWSETGRELVIHNDDFNKDDSMLLKSWQKDKDISVQLDLNIEEEDMAAVFSTIRPDREAGIFLIYHSLSTAHSSGTSISGLIARTELDSSKKSYHLEGKIPGTKVAGLVEISVVISLDAVHQPELKVLTKNLLVLAKEIGSKLWEKSVTVTLEGKVSFFPTEDFDFSKEGYPRNALYFLNRKNCSLDADFTTKYTLYFNNKHEEFIKINSPEEDRNDLLQLIKLDIYKQIIMDALQEEGFEYSTELKNESQSVRDVYTRLLKNISDKYFNGVDYKELKKYADPKSNYYNKFVMALQDSVLDFEVKNG